MASDGDRSSLSIVLREGPHGWTLSASSPYGQIDEQILPGVNSAEVAKVWAEGWFSAMEPVVAHIETLTSSAD
jgi:hypothetical protein